jgi:hypothetical protein
MTMLSRRPGLGGTLRRSWPVALILLGLLLAFGLILLGLTGDFLVDWLWFSEVGCLEIFWTAIVAKGVVFSVAFVATAIVLWLNGRDAAYRETRAAFGEHSVLVLRGQDVGDEAQLAFSRRFGPLEVTKVGSLGVGTNLVILSTIDESGQVVPADHRLALRNKANQPWHTDSTFKRVPALASVLSARVIVAYGGEKQGRMV